jgi:hypothetical protein
MKLMNQSKRATLSVAVSLLSACATIRNGRHQQIPLSSNPAGASVSIRCGRDAPTTAVTPATITVDRHSLPCQLTLRKEGYRDLDVVLQRQLSKEFWANLLWCPALSIAGYSGGQARYTTRWDGAAAFFILGIIPAAIGMGVDSGTGAKYKSVPPTVDVTLKPQ